MDLLTELQYKIEDIEQKIDKLYPKSKPPVPTKPVSMNSFPCHLYKKMRDTYGPRWQKKAIEFIQEGLKRNS